MIIEKTGAKHRTIKESPASKYPSFKSKRPCYNIRVDGFRAVMRVLNSIECYLVGKKKQAELVKEFIKSRKENMIQRDKLGHILRISYTEKEIDLLCRVKALNRNESPETIRLDLQKAGKI